MYITYLLQNCFFKGSFLDLGNKNKIEHKKINIQLYDTRNDFPFPINNYIYIYIYIYNILYKKISIYRPIYLFAYNPECNTDNNFVAI